MEKRIEPNPTYNEIVTKIRTLCSQEKSFTEKVEDLVSFIGKIDKEKEVYYLKNSGAIPESFEHDSSEEKLYAKFCDFLVSKFFELMGMESILCEERGDYADVIGKTKEYIVVADAKAFRLSRTALNPKDYKIEALNGWRKKAKGHYAILVAPINEFPKGKSRLYRESVKYNVLMISYSHLIFILNYKENKIDLKKLFDINSLLQKRQDVGAVEYWHQIGETMIEICSGEEVVWEDMKNKAKRDSLLRIDEQVKHLNEVVKSIDLMDEKKVKEILLESWGINQKLAQINRKKRFLEEGLPED